MAVPPVFTPNGDGVNETTEIRFDLFRMTGTRRLEVGIYDLNGRRVRDLSVMRQRPSGSHAIMWNGHDDDDALVPPGIYLARINVPIDSRQGVTDAVRTVHVVY
jgi:flagellar hook assembly protein FlgD